MADSAIQVNLLSDSAGMLSVAAELRANGWLPHHYKIIQPTFDSSGHWVGTLGLDISAVANAISLLFPAEPLFFFTESRLSNGNPMEMKGFFVGFSSSHWVKDFKDISPHVLFCLHVLKWTFYLLRNEGKINCDNECLVSQKYNLKSLLLCKECQGELYTNGEDELVSIALALHTLSTQNSDVAQRLLKGTIGQTFSHFRVSSTLPSINVMIAERTLEWKARTGSDTRTWLTKASVDVYRNKDKVQKEYIETVSSLPRYPILIAARRWNSWTPTRPFGMDVGIAGASKTSEILLHRTGGGYFISDGSANIAVDPGYGYLELLYRLYGITIQEIDAIVITHDHPDHSAELNNILTLRFAYRDHCSRPLAILLNASSYYLFRPLLEYYQPLLESCGARKLQPGKTYAVEGLSIRTVGMEHEEIVAYCPEAVRRKVGKSTALGLRIEGRTSAVSKGRFNFAIVGDTSFPEDVQAYGRLCDAYGKADIAAIHLGSIEQAWSNPSTEAIGVTYGRGERNIGKHLGIVGCAKMISVLQPRMAVITEFGKELDTKSYRRNLTDIIKSFSSSSQSVVLPSDIGLAIALKDEKILGRCECKSYVPVELLHVTERKGYLWYAYDAGCDSGLEHHALETR